jgi:hypothetical protein
MLSVGLKSSGIAGFMYGQKPVPFKIDFTVQKTPMSAVYMCGI